jgi:hypothetical protein
VKGESRLRDARNGDEVRYKAVLGGLNNDLLTNAVNGVYTLYSEQGGAGYLRPMRPEGTIISLR